MINLGPNGEKKEVFVEIEVDVDPVENAISKCREKWLKLVLQNDDKYRKKICDDSSIIGSFVAKEYSDSVITDWFKKATKVEFPETMKSPPICEEEIVECDAKICDSFIIPCSFLENISREERLENAWDEMWLKMNYAVSGDKLVLRDIFMDVVGDLLSLQFEYPVL